MKKIKWRKINLTKKIIWKKEEKIIWFFKICARNVPTRLVIKLLLLK